MLRVIRRTARGLSSPGAGGTFGLAVGGPFWLTDTRGHSVTDASFRGRWMLVYSGDTSCPDICPTELATIAAVLRALGPEADRVAPLVITIDPARDTRPGIPGPGYQEGAGRL